MKNTEQFLSAMRDRHGISEDFIAAGRPLVDAIFAEFDGKQRADLLDFAESIFAQQAATEKSIRASTRSLHETACMLERAVTDFFQSLETLRHAVAPRPVVREPLVARWQLN